MREVFRNDFYSVRFDEGARLVRLTRTAVAQTVEELLGTAAELPAVIAPLRPARLLLDMRLAPGNNDPNFERNATLVLQKLMNHFAEVAVLVQTAVGKLHFKRMSRENGQPLQLFFDEEEALRYLKSAAAAKEKS